MKISPQVKAFVSLLVIPVAVFSNSMLVNIDAPLILSGIINIALLILLCPVSGYAILSALEARNKMTKFSLLTFFSILIIVDFLLILSVFLVIRTV